MRRHEHPGEVLRRRRSGLGWSQQRLIAEMQRVAQARGKSVASSSSLKSMISRWERGHIVPDAYNRKLLCAALRIAVSDLGLPDTDPGGTRPPLSPS